MYLRKKYIEKVKVFLEDGTILEYNKQSKENPFDYKLEDAHLKFRMPNAWEKVYLKVVTPNYQIDKIFKRKKLEKKK